MLNMMAGEQYSDLLQQAIFHRAVGMDEKDLVAFQQSRELLQRIRTQKNLGC